MAQTASGRSLLLAALAFCIVFESVAIREYEALEGRFAVRDQGATRMDTTHEAKSSKRLRVHFCRRCRNVTREDAKRQERKVAGNSTSPAVVHSGFDSIHIATAYEKSANGSCLLSHFNFEHNAGSASRNSSYRLDIRLPPGIITLRGSSSGLNQSRTIRIAFLGSP